MGPHDPWRLATYGPFYRVAQSDAVTREQERLGEIWGRANRYSDIPSVDAWVGPLPFGRTGVEFYTAVAPSPGSPPPRARWIGPRDGVRVEEGWAKIEVRIARARYTGDIP